MNYEIKDIMSVGGNRKYTIIRNSDNKVWIIPCKNMNIGMGLYQPSSTKGKILKCLLPYTYKIKLVRNIIGIELENIFIEDIFINKIEDVFGVENLEYSFFLGTPSIHQKVTIQVYKDRQILGYCKITDKDEVIELFNSEKDILDYLHVKGINNVPKCLFTGKLNCKYNIFIQSTIKTCNSEVAQELDYRHVKFLKEMEEKTKVYCTYENSDYKNSIDRLKIEVNYLDKHFEKEEVLKAIKIVENSIKNQKYFSIYHNDFTPWNMFFENNELFVFDFEYSKKLYPPLIDIFHFYTQTAILVRRENSKEIYEKFKEQFIYGEFKNLFFDPVQYYMYYLLDIISLYISREKGIFSKEVERNIKIWIEILSMLNINYYNY